MHTDSSSIRIAAHAQAQAQSPLIRLPLEVLSHIAFFLATTGNVSGPDLKALGCLIRCCRLAYERLAWSPLRDGNGNTGLWRRITRRTFELGDGALVADLSLALADTEKKGKNKAGDPLSILPTLIATLRVLRSGDVHHPMAGPALRVALAMMWADAGDAEPLVGTLTSGLGGAGCTRSGVVHGKNRHLLASVNVRAFAMRYTRERSWEGRWGELDGAKSMGEGVDALLLSPYAEPTPSYGPEWKVGWPRDTQALAAAFWVLWMFEDRESLRAESDAERQSMMKVLLPWVTIGFRYPSSLAPAHHYTIPLLPSVRSLLEEDGGVEGITVPTFHGAYPIYPVPLGTPPPIESESASGSGSAAVSGSGSGSTPTPSTATSHRHRLPYLLPAPAARLLFFARLQAGARMAVPPHLPRDRAEAERRWIEGGNQGLPLPVGPTQADIYEKNARPIVRFESQAPYVARDYEAGEDEEDEDEEDYTLFESGAWHYQPQNLGGAPPPVPPPASLSGVDIDDDGASASASTSTPSGPVRDAPAGTALPRQRAAEEAARTQRRTAARTRRRDEKRRRLARWAAYRYRGRTRGRGRRLVDGTGAGSARVVAPPSPPPPPPALPTPQGLATRQARQREARQQRQGPGGAPPGHIGRVYDLGSFAGLWAGSMMMPSEPALMSLIATPNGAFPTSGPGGGLPTDDLLAAVRPVYMRITEYHSFSPNAPLPPPPADSTTGDEGLASGWLPSGMRVVGASGGGSEGQVELRVPADPSSWEAWGDLDRHFRRHPAEESKYVYERVLDTTGTTREGAHDTERCPGCVRRRERRARERAVVSTEEGLELEEELEDGDDWEDEEQGGECDGVQDVIFTGETDLVHGQAWHHYEFAGRVRPWDGLIGLVMRPRDRTLGHATFIITGHIAGRDTFEGTWRMAGQDVLAPNWGGSLCMARGTEF